MGYFSNGTEGMMYEERYCSKCVHYKPEDGGCMVWLAHLIHNYDQHDNDGVKAVLDLLIPRKKDDLANEQCSMFHQDTSERCTETKDLFT